MSKGNRIPLKTAEFIVNEVIAKLSANDITVYVTGSILRKKEDVGDIDIVLDMANFEKLEMISDKLIPDIFDELLYTKGTKKNPPKLNGAIKNDVKVEFYVAKEGALGSMILYTVGSGDFNIRQRRVAQSKGMLLSQHGLFKNDVRIAGETEEEIFKMLDMEYVSPEKRD